MIAVEIVEHRLRQREAAVEEHARRVFADPSTIRRVANAPTGAKPWSVRRRRAIEALIAAELRDARALDEATVALLRETSSPEVLRRVDLEERYGWSAYGDDVRQVGALMRFVERTLQEASTW